MFVEQLRAAIEASPRCELTKLSAVLWRAVAADAISEDEASALSQQIELRKGVRAPTGQALNKPVGRVIKRVGSRPHTPASLERRRRWVASGWLPPAIAARFTLGEQAVLAVIATEHARHGRCTLAHDHVAVLAGVSRTTVKNALRAAKAIGLIEVTERRLSAFHNRPNLVTITDAFWRTWLRMRGRSHKGANPCPPRIHRDKTAAFAPRNRDWAADAVGSTKITTPGIENAPSRTKQR